MTEQSVLPPAFDDSWMTPLWRLTCPGNPPALRLAALTAALRFPLGGSALKKVVEFGSQLLVALPPGDPVRQAAIRLAIQVPLLSARETLRRMAADPDEPDRRTAASALEEIGDASRSSELLQRARQGDAESFFLLAISPLELGLAKVADIPRCPTGSQADTLFWRALVLARLQEYQALQEVWAGSAPLPELFTGNPWLAWEKIARLRPCPDAMLIWLTAQLEQSTRDQQDRQPTAHLQALRLTAWAITGQADAEGRPLDQKGFGPVTLPPDSQLATDADRQDAGHLIFNAILRGYSRPQQAWMLAVMPTRHLVEETVAIIGREPDQAFSFLDLLARAADFQRGFPFSPTQPEAGLFQLPLRKVSLIDDRTRSLHHVRSRASSMPATIPGAGELAASRTSRTSILIDTSHVEYERGPAPAEVDDAESSFDLSTGDATIDPWIDDLPAEMASAPVNYEETTSDHAGFTLPPLSNQGKPADRQERESRQTTSSEKEPAAEQRLVRGRILVDEIEHPAFVAGVENILRCWIGLPADDDAAQADQPIPQAEIPIEGLSLSVELLWKDQDDQQHTAQGSLHLPASRTSRSSDCDLLLAIPAAARYLSADVLFRYRGRVFEAVKMEAAVLAAGESASPRDALRIRVLLSRRQVMELSEATPCAATLVSGELPSPADEETAPSGGAERRVNLRIFTGDSGTASYTIEAPDRAMASLQQILFSAEKNLVRRRAGEPDSEVHLATDDEEVRGLLRDMAAFGAGLHKNLQRQGFLGTGERIQILELNPDQILPLELVYDKGYPGEEATLCPSWQGPFNSQTNRCPSCGDGPVIDEDQGVADTVCPYGFWALRKIIERLTPGAARASSAPGAERQRLPVLDCVVFAASDKVPLSACQAAWNTISAKFTTAEQPATWPDWRQAVRSKQPDLLVVLPHHDLGPLEDFLEIGSSALRGSAARLWRNQISPAYVNPHGLQPGPILLLLGCTTGSETDHGYHGLVHEFHQQKAAIVLGTLAQILGRHAAPLAEEIVCQLVAVRDEQADFGTILRDVRRNLLLRGYLLGFSLVAVGDAAWHITPRP